MKTDRKNAASTDFMGYTDAPPEIEKAMESAVPVKDFLPPPGQLVPKVVSEKERRKTAKTWKRYIIKAHERGHRIPLSKLLHEPTKRLDTSIILPRSVYKWVKEKPNKAAFIRETMIRSYEKSAH